jgi:hypothetical protein
VLLQLCRSGSSLCAAPGNIYFSNPDVNAGSSLILARNTFKAHLQSGNEFGIVLKGEPLSAEHKRIFRAAFNYGYYVFDEEGDY